MKTTLPRSLRLAALLLCTAVAAAQNPVDAMWSDASFRKHFLGGYGVASDVEPRMSEDEVAVLQEVLPLMATDLAAAEKVLKRAIEPQSSARLDFVLGGIQLQQALQQGSDERLKDALATHRTAVEKFPSYRRAWSNLGLINARLGNHDETIRAFTRTIELGGADAWSYGVLGFAYTAKQDYQPAEAAFRNALLLQPDSTQWRLGLAQCVVKQQKFEDAAALLDALLAHAPGNADYWLLQAHAFLGMKKNLRAAENLEVVDRLGKAKPDSAFTLGDIYAAEDLVGLAVRAYARAVALDPKQPMARALQAAEMLTGRGATAEARTLLATIRETLGGALVDADRRRLLKLEARCAMAEGDRSAEVVRVLEEVVKIDPLDGEALLLLGKHHAANNEPDRAIFYFERAASIEAFEAEAKIRHAQILAGQGRFADAVPLLRRAQQIRPRDDVARYLEAVERNARGRR